MQINNFQCYKWALYHFLLNSSKDLWVRTSQTPHRKRLFPFLNMYLVPESVFWLFIFHGLNKSLIASYLFLLYLSLDTSEFLVCLYRWFLGHIYIYIWKCVCFLGLLASGLGRPTLLCSFFFYSLESWRSPWTSRLPLRKWRNRKTLSAADPVQGQVSDAWWAYVCSFVRIFVI